MLPPPDADSGGVHFFTTRAGADADKICRRAAQCQTGTITSSSEEPWI
jgi:hypothetical protein